MNYKNDSKNVLTYTNVSTKVRILLLQYGIIIIIVSATTELKKTNSYDQYRIVSRYKITH